MYRKFQNQLPWCKGNLWDYIYALEITLTLLILSEVSRFSIPLALALSHRFRITIVRRSKGSRLERGPGSWYSHAQPAHSPRKPGAGTRLEPGLLALSHFPKSCRGGGVSAGMGGPGSQAGRLGRGSANTKGVMR